MKKSTLFAVSTNLNTNGHSVVDESSISLIKDLPVAIYVCDMRGKITFYNKAAVSLWGREPETGKDLWCGSWKIFYADETPVDLSECPMAVTIKNGKEIKVEELIIERPDGSRAYIIPHPKIIYDSDGNASGAINLLIDITERRIKDQVIIENERKYRELSESLEKIVETRTSTLKRSEERYHRMIDEVQDYAILLLDVDGNILNWNKGAEKIKGYSEEDIIGKNFRTFYLPEDRERKLPDQLLARAVATGRAMHEGWRMRKDGTKFWGSIVLTALHDDQNNVIGFSKVTRDLTEKKLSEMQLRQYATDIENQNKKLEEFVYIASHDLQEPLRKILTFADLLERNIDDREAIKRNLEKITGSAQRMSNLIKDILKYSRLSKTDEFAVETDLNQIFDEVLESFSLLIEQRKAIIKKTNLPVINCIPVHIYQLFSNLLSNAIKFCNTNPVIHLSSGKLSDNEIYNQHLDVSKTYYKIKFEDNGIGFNQEYADQIFKLFKRFNDKKQGTGIGLALCKQIVESHKGKINVKSAPGKGTTFEIILPGA